MKKIIYIVLGSLLVVLGTIGIFVPLLPTTIFLILASYFFMKGSPKLNDKLLSNKYLGKYIKDYKENKGLSRKSKISSITFLWLSIFISMYFVRDNAIILVLLLLIAIGVTIHIVSLKNLQTDTAD